MTLLSKINQTPGLLDSFKQMCIDSSPARHLTLTADEKTLFEQYKTALAQG